MSSAALRRDLSRRNLDRANCHQHELSYGAVPNIIYRDEEGAHGNFVPASCRAICAHPEWQRRLSKSNTGGRWIARSWERKKA